MRCSSTLTIFVALLWIHFKNILLSTESNFQCKTLHLKNISSQLGTVQHRNLLAGGMLCPKLCIRKLCFTWRDLVRVQGNTQCSSGPQHTTETTGTVSCSSCAISHLPPYHMYAYRNSTLKQKPEQSNNPRGSTPVNGIPFSERIQASFLSSHSPQGPRAG